MVLYLIRQRLAIKVKAVKDGFMIRDSRNHFNIGYQIAMGMSKTAGQVYFCRE